MHYMMLIYSKESPEGASPEEAGQIMAAHRRVMDEASEKGVLLSAAPLAPTTTATTVRMDGCKVLVFDGPFAETKEQLAGYYILECGNLDQAIEWASKIPTACKGKEGCVEIRPLPWMPIAAMPALTANETLASCAAQVNG